jgi:hypothetical protein
MIVRLPGLLDSYTAGARRVQVDVDADANLDAVLRELDRRYPGLRFRVVDEQDSVRPHIKMFLDGELTKELKAPAGQMTELMIVGALSGG